MRNIFLPGFLGALLIVTGARSQTLIEKQTFTAAGSYTVPAGAGIVVVKAWGAGGSGSMSLGGGGGFVTATYLVFPGETIAFTMGGYSGLIGGSSAGAGAGGAATEVRLYRTSTTYSQLIAGGGGGGGKTFNGAGGAGGGASGQAGGPGYANSGGGGGTQTAGGTGGPGSSYTNDNPPYNAGNGSSGGRSWAGASGDWGVASDATSGASGGGGGNGYYGGGGGGTSGDSYSAGGGGGGGGASIGGSSSVFGYLSSTLTGGNGQIPGGISDADYPGLSIGYGGNVNASGQPGAAVISVYTPAGPVPSITSPLNPQFISAAAYTYTVTATGSPTYFEAIGLPGGWAINATTGVISGTTVASANQQIPVTVRASNANGTGSATIVWTCITADTQAPTTPTNLSASSVTSTSLTLSWTAATDNVSVGAYRVYVDERWIGDVVGTSINVTGLSPGRNYNFTVRARDTSNNWGLACSLTLATGPHGTLDTDGDGMPDDWETFYGLNPNDPSDAVGDADGDGISNLDEFRLGTRPTSAITTDSASSPQNQLKVNTPTS